MQRVSAILVFRQYGLELRELTLATAAKDVIWPEVRDGRRRSVRRKVDGGEFDTPYCINRLAWRAKILSLRACKSNGM